MKHKYFLIIFIFSALQNQIVYSQSSISFTNLDSVISYSKENSSVTKTNDQQLLLANWQKKSAQLGVINFKMQSSFSLIDNVLLPVTFLPGEAFGGDPGTFKEVTTGQPYIGNLTLIPQIDLINPSNWSKVKGEKINQELTQTNNLISEKTLNESIAAIYYNILTLQEQIKITEKNLALSDTLLIIVDNKYVQGLVRKQDLNNVKINKINLLGKLEQLNTLLEQQYLGLKILCDIPLETQLLIEDDLYNNSKFELNLHTNNQLLYRASLLKTEKINADLRTNNLSQLPSLSLVGYSAWQQNSDVTFFDKDREWINSQYVGLKLNIPFPDVNKYMLSKSLSINRDIANINAEHTKLYNDLTNVQMTLDYEIAFSELKTAKKVFILKEDNYKIALQQFEMGILPTDALLIAFNDLLLSQLDYSSALATLQFTKSKILINNSIK